MPKKAKAVKQTAVVIAEARELPAIQERENTSVEAFITQAITQGVPVETMEKLLAMRRELKSEQATQAFIAAMASFQAKCPIITKDKIVYEKNSDKIRYKFAPLDSIINQVREFIGKNGLSYTIDVKNEDGRLTAMCKITHILGHSEISSFEVPIDRDSYMSAPQKYAAASTFAKRYALCNALGILTGDEDTDAADTDTNANAKVAAKVPAADNPVFSKDRKALEASKTLAELGAAWSKLNGPAKIALGTLKDELKAMITSETEPA